MEFLQPTTLDEALAMRAEYPGSTPVAGGTDLMVDVNFDRARPEVMIDLMRVPELTAHGRDNGHVSIGATVPFVEIIDAYAADLPGLTQSARTVGSPQIRNRGTLGGNLGTASPAGDALPPLLASDAHVKVASRARGDRTIAAVDFVVAPRRSALEDDELIVSVQVPVAAGPQQFSKVGPRNSMVIAITSVAVALDTTAQTVGASIGSSAPTPVRAPDAESWLAGELTAADLWNSADELPESVAAEFGRRLAAAASPIDDVRGTAAYRSRAIEVVGKRSITWAWRDHRKALA